MKKVTIIVSCIVLLLIFGLGYTGLVPGISSVLGTDKPKNLGVTYPTGMPEIMVQKAGPAMEKLPLSNSPIGSIRFSGSKSVIYTFNSQEITALVNYKFWKYNPFSDVQVKIHDDGTVETSGRVNMSLVLSAIEAHGFQVGDVRAAMKKYMIPEISMPAYVSFKGDVIDNKIDLTVLSAKAGNISIPNNVIQENQERLTSALESLADAHNGFYIKKLQFGAGTIQFDGRVPEKEEAVTD